MEQNRPSFYDQCTHSNVCTGTPEERWARCQSAVATDYCQRHEIKLTSKFKPLAAAKVYEYVFEGSCLEISLACACPTAPKSKSKSAHTQAAAVGRAMTRAAGSNVHPCRQVALLCIEQTLNGLRPHRTASMPAAQPAQAKKSLGGA